MNIESKVQERGHKGITTSQLRLLLSNAALVRNKIEIENLNNPSDMMSIDLQNDVKYLLIKHIYQCGRDHNVKDFDKDFEISKKLQAIGSSRKAFFDFYRYLEEIVAYTKFYRS